MQFDILTIFPEIINNYGAASILGRAQKENLIKIFAHDFREFTTDKHRRVDDKPYGGGPGMILQIQPIYDCLESIKAKRKNSKEKIIIMDPAGKKFDQRMAEKFSKLERLVLICGRYEGFDARIYQLADERISVGDYVLAGGELPALTVVEAVSRLIPGVLGNVDSLEEETFSNHESRIMNHGDAGSQNRNSKFIIHDSSFKEYPQYTRPEEFMGKKVPNILLSGDHKKIAEWRNIKSK